MQRIFIIDHTGENKVCRKCGKKCGKLGESVFANNHWHCIACAPGPAVKEKENTTKEHKKRAPRGALRDFIIEKFKEKRSLEVKDLIEEALKNDVTESGGSVGAIIFQLKKEGKIAPLSRGVYVWKK
jgi:hypothetical protein